MKHITLILTIIALLACTNHKAQNTNNQPQDSIQSQQSTINSHENFPTILGGRAESTVLSRMTKMAKGIHSSFLTPHSSFLKRFSLANSILPPTPTSSSSPSIWHPTSRCIATAKPSKPTSPCATQHFVMASPSPSYLPPATSTANSKSGIANGKTHKATTQQKSAPSCATPLCQAHRVTIGAPTSISSPSSPTIGLKAKVSASTNGSA